LKVKKTAGGKGSMTVDEALELASVGPTINEKALDDFIDRNGLAHLREHKDPKLTPIQDKLMEALNVISFGYDPRGISKAASMQGWADVKVPEKPVALRAQLLREAEEITCGDRHMDYGDPVGNHDNIAKIASIATGKDLTAHDVVMVLIAAKIARARISPSKRDHYVDLMAYAGIAYECVMDELRDE